jgi:hypothetical protein
MFECYTCHRSIHEPSFECGTSEDEKAFTMEVSGTRRWMCPFCRLDTTMAVARSITDVANKEPESRDDWDSGTRSDTEGEDGIEVMDYGHRTAYPAKPTSTTPEVAPKKSVTWGKKQVQEYPISKRDIRDMKYVDSVMEADPRYAKEQALIAQSAAVEAPADMSVDSSTQEGEVKSSQAQKKKATRSIRKNKRTKSRNIASASAEAAEVVTETESKDEI